MKKLFKLVKALDKGEKRMITDQLKRLESSGKKVVHLKQLFKKLQKIELLDQQKDLENRKHASELYKLTLETLAQSRSKYSIDANIHQYLAEERFLLEKKLVEQCFEKLERAEALAHKTGDILSLIEINKRKRHLYKLLPRRVDPQVVKDLQNEGLTLIHELNLELKYNNFYDELYSRTLEDETESQKKLTAFITFSSKPEQVPSFMQGHRRYLLCKALYYLIIKDYPNYYTSFSQVRSWWSKNKEFKLEAPLFYFGDLKNFLFSWMIRPEFDPKNDTFVQTIFDEFDQIDLDTTTKNGLKKNERLRKYNEDHKLSMRVFYLLAVQDYEAFKQIIPEIEVKTEVNNYNYYPLIFNTSEYFLQHREHQACKDWCKKIIRRKNAFRPDIQKGIRIYNILSSLELDQEVEEEAFKNACRSARRFFRAFFKLETDDFHMALIRLLNRYYDATMDSKSKRLEEVQNFVKQQPKGICPSIVGINYWLAQKMKSK